MKKLLTRTLLCVAVSGLLGGCDDEDIATVTANVADFHVSVKANGELASQNTAFLTPPSVRRMWQYKINFLVPEGSYVKKGQVVARFETNKLNDKLRQKLDELSTVSKELENELITQEKELEDLKVQLAQREVAVRKAKRKSAQVDESTSKVEAEKLQLDKSIAEQDLTLYQEKMSRFKAKSELELSIKKREKQSLEAEVNKLKGDIAKLSIKAPKSGMFIYASNFKGDKFAVGDTLHTGQNFAEIPSLDKMIVKAKISERNLGRLNEGMAVEIVLDANAEKKYYGTLKTLGSVIREKAKNSPEKIIEAEIAINEPDHELMRPGMIARLSVVVDTHKDVVIVPTSAVILKGGKAVVRMKSMLGETEREVEVVAFDEQSTAISNGLSAGEEVIL